MTETEKNKGTANKREDWAILPFDEKEDDARWSKLIEETEQLAEDAAETEAVFGELLMENTLSEIKQTEKPTEDELF